MEAGCGKSYGVIVDHIFGRLPSGYLSEITYTLTCSAMFAGAGLFTAMGHSLSGWCICNGIYPLVTLWGVEGVLTVAPSSFPRLTAFTVLVFVPLCGRVVNLWPV